MADFEFEDGTPAKPAKSEPAKPSAPAFNPFDAPVSVPKPGAPAPLPAAPAAKAAPAKPAAAKPAPPPASPPAEDEADIKPGSRKDLWKCPHCGAGNKPERADCRVCAKRPSDPVVVPWFRKPAVLGGLAAAVVAVVAILAVILRADLSLHPADLTGLDRAPRTGGSARGVAELGDGLSFERRDRLAVCGRVARVAGSGRSLTVHLALGRNAAVDEDFAALGDSPAAGPGVAVLNLVAAEGVEPPKLARGHWLSVSLARGILLREGRLAGEPAEGECLLLEAGGWKTAD